MRLIKDLYVYLWAGVGNNSNSYLFGGDIPTLIDPGMVRTELGEPSLSHLLSSLERDGFKAEDIGLIINTHAHPDHNLANRPLIETSQAKLAYHREEQNHLLSMFKAFGMKPPEWQPDFYLKEGELSLGVGNRIDLQVFHTPGHSPGSICIYWPEEKVLITGDLIFRYSVGRVDVPGGSWELLKQGIERMAQLDIEYLLPGHMGMVTGRDNVQRNFDYIRRAFFP